MTSKFTASAVLAFAALTSVAASAETFNLYLWDQVKAPMTKSRVEVKADMLRAPKDASATVAPTADSGAADPQKPGAPSAGKTGAASRADALFVRTGGQ